MKNNSVKVIIIVLVVLVIVGLGVGSYFIFFNKDKENNKLEEELTKMVTDYYDNEFVKYMPDLLKKNGELQLGVDNLKEVGKDVSLFEEHECDFAETYVKLIAEDDGYKTEVHLSCSK